jgi:hypothetical protein
MLQTGRLPVFGLPIEVECERKLGALFGRRHPDRWGNTAAGSLLSAELQHYDRRGEASLSVTTRRLSATDDLLVVLSQVADSWSWDAGEQQFPPGIEGPEAISVDGQARQAHFLVDGARWAAVIQVDDDVVATVLASRWPRNDFKLSSILDLRPYGG